MKDHAMTVELEYPELTWKEGQLVPAIEVSIDFLPREYQGNWHRAVQAYTARWVKEKEFKKKGSLWMWGCISVNMISRHPEVHMPTWSDFIIQFGLPTNFIPGLSLRLERVFKGQAAITEHLQSVRDHGWVAICHVEQNKAWIPKDGDSWIPFSELAKK